MVRKNNLTLFSVITDIIVDIVFFPFWWYSLGLVKTIQRLINFVNDKQKSLALLVWMKNLFVPMYGQRDIQGFIISFFIRLIQIIFRSLALVLWTVFAVIIFIAWLVFPALVIYETVKQML